MVLIQGLRRAVLRRLFESLYRLGRWVYDPLTSIFFGPSWHNWRRSVLPWVEVGPALEIACGTGQLLPELARISGLVVGFDRSESMLAAAHKQAQGPGIAIVQAEAGHLPFADGAFATAISTFPASFIAQRQVLDEVARVLKPGGSFVVVVSARFTTLQWRRPFVHPVLRLAYGSSLSMNRWPDELLEHPDLPGAWHDLPTPEGEAFAWVAQRRKSINPAAR